MVDKEIPQLDVAGSIPVARSNQDEGVTGPPRSPSPPPGQQIGNRRCGSTQAVSWILSQCPVRSNLEPTDEGERPTP